MKSLMGCVMVVGVLFAAVRSEGARINVPADQATVQSGINAASNGDTVLVADGMYFENVQIRTKLITLASQFIIDGNPSHILNTIINGSTPVNSDTGSCVIIAGALSAGSLIRGFTLTGGTGTRWKDISDNLTYREGGGILIEANNVRVYDNLIVNNFATNTSGSTSAGGGGVRCGFGSAEFVHNIIANNQGRYGSGLVAFFSTVTIENNVVYGNTGSQSFGGAGLWIWQGNLTSSVVNNTIVNNSTSNNGGGISIFQHSVNLANNIIYGNTAVTGPQIYVSTGGVANVSYSDVQGGFAGTGNLNSDPMFLAADFLLNASSPCVDAGDPGIGFNDPEDMGNPGNGLAPSLGAVRNDMGAYGGPLSGSFPHFTSPSIGLALTPIEFDSMAVGGKDTASIILLKSGFGNANVDSVIIVTHPVTEFAVLSTIPHLWGVARRDTIRISWHSTYEGTMIDTALVYHHDSSVPNPIIAEMRGKACCRPCGDGNGDQTVNISDAVYLIAYIFAGGPAPDPLNSGNSNCDGTVNISDAVYLIAYIFAGGPAPCASCS